MNRLPLIKQDILSHYSVCFEGIGCFPGDPYKFHLIPEHKPARHAPKKVPIHHEDAFKEEIKFFVELGILEEVKEHTDWVNSYVIVEKNSGNHHAPDHTIKRKLRICVMILHYNTTLTPSSKAIYSGTKYYDTHIEFHSLFLDVSSTDV